MPGSCPFLSPLIIYAVTCISLTFSSSLSICLPTLPSPSTPHSHISPPLYVLPPFYLVSVPFLFLIFCLLLPASFFLPPSSLPFLFPFSLPPRGDWCPVICAGFWILTGVLMNEAIQRVIHPDFEVNSDVMLITAYNYVWVSLSMYCEYSIISARIQWGSGLCMRRVYVTLALTSCTCTYPLIFSMLMVLHQHSHSDGGRGGRGDRNQKNSSTTPSTNKKNRVRAENINVQAAFIHVIGDLVQSIGVVIAGYTISFWVIVTVISL